MATSSSGGDTPFPPHLFDQMANAVIQGELTYDNDGVPDDFIYIYVNPAFGRVMGLSSVVGRRVSEFIPDIRTSSTQLFMRFDRVLRTGISESFEDYSPALNRWYSTQVFRVDDRHFLAMCVEVTARKLTEQALARTQALLKEAQSIARIGCWQFDVGVDEFIYSEGMSDLFELGDDEILHRHTCADRVFPEDRPLVEAAFDGAVRSGTPIDVRHRIIARDASIRHFRVTGRADRTDDGGLRLIGTTQDVTDSVLLELALRESERRLTATIEASPVPLALNNDQGRILYLNAAFRRTFGYELSDIPTLEQWWPLAYPDPDYRRQIQQEWAEHKIEARLAGTPVRSREVEVRAKDGSVRTVIATANSVEPATDGLHLIEFYDITERKRLEERLRKQSACLQSVIDGSPNALIMFDVDGRLISVNRQFYEIHRIDPETQFVPEETTFDDVIHFLHKRGDFPDLPAVMLAAGFAGFTAQRERTNYERRTTDGRVLEIDAIPLESGGRLFSYKDVTDRARNLDDARAAALHDPLTHLPNRRALEEHFNAMIAVRPANSAFAALLMIDMDRFKALNDTFGHIYGDLLLAEVANRLKRRVRGSDLVARLGGDEFVVLLGGLADSRAGAKLAAEAIAEAIRASLAAPFLLQPTGETIDASGERVYTCPASIGGWILPSNVNTLTDAITMADKALYESKKQGGNVVSIY